MQHDLASMTGFAHAEGEAGGCLWMWELRSVNARGLDLRFRLPPGLDALEPALREAAGRRLRRGAVNATLSLKREAGATVFADPAALAQVMALAREIAERLPNCPPPRAELLLALPGVLRHGDAGESGIDAAMLPLLQAGFLAALDRLALARAAEGARLGVVLHALLGEIALHRAAAGLAAADQPAAQRARMLEAVSALLGGPVALPEERIAQEVALLAARSDVREELDRLDSHLAAAHALLAEAVGIGRRFDFLVQEFNREANTLCSKSASPALTEAGLRLKASIEQLREQVQNIE